MLGLYSRDIMLLNLGDLRAVRPNSFWTPETERFLEEITARGDNAESLEYHLDRSSAKDLLSKAIQNYLAYHGTAPSEVFIHGRARFDDEEWRGFCEAARELGLQTKVVGVTIRETSSLKLYRDVPGKSTYGVLRGTNYRVNGHEGYLWTRGFVPRLQTSTSLEVPNPLQVQISHGQSDISTILSDILSLTKVNYNACVLGDGIPVTLRFSNDVGKVLTALPNLDHVPLPFKYYI